MHNCAGSAGVHLPCKLTSARRSADQRCQGSERTRWIESKCYRAKPGREIGRESDRPSLASYDGIARVQRKREMTSGAKSESVDLKQLSRFIADRNGHCPGIQRGFVDYSDARRGTRTVV